jgi:hypothetical protein
MSVAADNLGNLFIGDGKRPGSPDFREWDRHHRRGQRPVLLHGRRRARPDDAGPGRRKSGDRQGRKHLLLGPIGQQGTKGVRRNHQHRGGNGDYRLFRRWRPGTASHAQQSREPRVRCRRQSLHRRLPQQPGFAGGLERNHLHLRATAWLCEGLVFDAAGNLYASDETNSTVYRIDTTGKQTVFAGTGSAGFRAMAALRARQCSTQPSGLAMDALGNLYIADAVKWTRSRGESAGALSTLSSAAAPMCGNWHLTPPAISMDPTRRADLVV